jgi:acetyl-CoA carboxylase biotin carboxyl carrier protein
MADDFPLTPEDVADIVAILSDTKYQRLEVSTSRFKLLVTRGATGWSQEWRWGESPPSEDAVAEERQIAAAPTADYGGKNPIKSVMPGTFYHSPRPGAAPYVAEGDVVTEATVVGIVETMKLMTPVLARTAGRIEKILVSNGTLIDCDTALMLVDPQARD